MNPSTTTSCSETNETMALAGLYGLLARLWLREVDAALLEQLRSPALCEIFMQAGGSLPGKETDRAVAELATDYCQLFIGPTEHLPPFQSVWQSGQFQSEATTSMRRWSKVTHYKPAPSAMATMPDHLGVQLDVMGRIVGGCFGAEGTSNRNGSADAVAQSFFHHHLSWPTPLLELAIRRTKSTFYRSMIEMTRVFLESEQHKYRDSRT